MSGTLEELHRIQASAKLGDVGTRERELGALAEAMDELGCERGTVVTLDDASTVKHGGREIEAVPAWQWLLS
ncbi:MAG: hypothetical protein IPN34_12815 [Planctomycetes bacterium]|nr:hypothetical protein [Planctomycetota bacterium]